MICLPSIGRVSRALCVKNTAENEREVNENMQMGNQMGNSGSNSANVPEARAALDSMKFEIARELGINLKQGYNGDLTSRENGYVGGYMVKRLIEQAERQMAGK